MVVMSEFYGALQRKEMGDGQVIDFQFKNNQNAVSLLLFFCNCRSQCERIKIVQCRYVFSLDKTMVLIQSR